MRKGDIITAYDSHFYEIIKIDEISGTLERTLHKNGKLPKKKMCCKMPVSLLKKPENKIVQQINNLNEQIENLYDLLEKLKTT